MLDGKCQSLSWALDAILSVTCLYKVQRSYCDGANDRYMRDHSYEAFLSKRRNEIFCPEPAGDAHREREERMPEPATPEQKYPLSSIPIFSLFVMSDPSDENHDASASKSASRPSAHKSAKQSELERLKSARAKSGVNRAEVRIPSCVIASLRMLHFEYVRFGLADDYRVPKSEFQVRRKD